MRPPAGSPERELLEVTAFGETNRKPRAEPSTREYTGPEARQPLGRSRSGGRREGLARGSLRFEPAGLGVDHRQEVPDLVAGPLRGVGQPGDLTAATESFPHEFVASEEGRNFLDQPWRPSDSRLDDVAQTALEVNLLTEDNLPYYHLAIWETFGGDGPWAEWIRRWTAEEGGRMDQAEAVLSAHSMLPGAGRRERPWTSRRASAADRFPGPAPGTSVVPRRAPGSREADLPDLELSPGRHGPERVLDDLAQADTLRFGVGGARILRSALELRDDLVDQHALPGPVVLVHARPPGARTWDGWVSVGPATPGRRMEACRLPCWSQRQPQPRHDARGSGPSTTRIRVE